MQNAACSYKNDNRRTSDTTITASFIWLDQQKKKCSSFLQEANVMFSVGDIYKKPATAPVKAAVLFTQLDTMRATDTIVYG